MKLQRFSVEGIFPLRQERIALEVFKSAARGSHGRFAIEAASLVEVVVFVPHTGIQAVIAKCESQRRDHAITIDIVFGSAYGKWRTTGRSYVRRTPQALSFVGVLI